MNDRAERSSRLKAILARTSNPQETGEEVKARIRKIVEQGNHVCSHCGFDKFTGSIHPYAGISAKTKNQTQWCNGTITIASKDAPKTYEWACMTCFQHWFYSQAELEIADENGKCHECMEKGKK